ncbi:hypothetical protein [Mammaliicoccus sp. P-M59]|uniref:hypothetical protein n=1 Tax=Mammaliicoccus sp. P-M59 TaxID=2898718 RepID=UPI001EFBF4F4|nr:hypothetical protein [Mammaliicoccus sp. P-M59]
MELKNTYELELDRFKIYIDLRDYNLQEIIHNETNKKFTNQEFDKKETWELLFDLISSRLSSEAVVMKMEDENKVLKEDNKKLAEGLKAAEQEIEDWVVKYNTQENFIEENREKLEG